MADGAALRDRVLEIAKDRFGDRYTVNDLFSRVSRHFDGNPPVGRATFYRWFGQRDSPKQSILECVPAFAVVLDVPEYDLWSAANVLSIENEMALALAAVANDLRQAYRRMRKTLSENGLSTAGEALVVDRILHQQLDYRMTVWPVVRGRQLGLHLHSWIVLTPIPEEESTRRLTTSILLDASGADRRRFIREEVITEGLWRTLGLKWRNRVPVEFEHLGEEPLFIEVPVEERNRPRPPHPSPGTGLDRLLVLGAPWSHAELMAALLADALRFGSWDLRYIGFPTGRSLEAKEQFCREKLQERRSGYVWAIAQHFEVMQKLHQDILDAADGAPVVVVTYGEKLSTFTAKTLRARRPADVGTARAVVTSLVEELRDHTDVIHVQIADDDVLTDDRGAPNPEPVVRDLAVDLIRALTARVLDQLRWQGLGPAPEHWGSRFDDLRLAGEPNVPHGASTVEWLPQLPQGPGAGSSSDTPESDSTS